ncbi:MAG: sensor histidine kinase [Bacteroidota bacterium]
MFIKEIRRRTEHFLLHQSVWMFVAILLTISLLHTIDLDRDFRKNVIDELPGWGVYLRGTAVLLLVYFPILIFEWFLPGLKKRFTEKWQFYGVWAGFYLVFIILINVLITNFFANAIDSIIYEELILITGIWLFILSALLQLQHLLKNQHSMIEWARKLTLDHAILIVLLVFALILSTAVVSDYENFRNNKAINMDFELGEVINRFPVFITIFLQLMMAYLGGYFFYFVNSRLLISKLLKKKGIVHYMAGVAGTIAIFFPLISQLLNWLPVQQQMGILTPSENQHIFAIENGGFAIGVIALSIPVILVIQWFQQNSEINMLEKEKAQTELNLLKQQINPHFFFNTLNNLYALSLAKSDATPEVVLQLSELMRYVIYKGKNSRVAISEEVKYLEDYIQLQQIRLNKTLDLSFEKEVDDQDLMIPPLLLIILIENAFKHGIEPAENESFLHIDLTTDQDTIYFECVNSYEPPSETSEGIGLSNLKRRLELTYPNRYQLDIDQTKDTFKASLKIELS